MNVDGGLQISDFGGILRRRAKVVGATALVLFLASYWLAMALPNTYTSYATVLVEPQAIAGELVKAGVRESDLNERLHLMTAQILARPRLSRIIDELKLYEEESGRMLREQIIDLMRARIRVEPVIPELEQRAARTGREHTIKEFRIFFDSYDSIVARNVAQRLANDFIETHINARVQTTQKSLEFIEGELERLSVRIRKAEADIKRVKSENPGKLPEDMDASQRRLERVLGDLSVAQRAHAEASSDEGFYASQLAAARGSAAGDDASPVRRLELLKLGLADLLSRGFTEKHPDIVKTRQEIEEVQRSIEADHAENAATPVLSPFAQQTEAQARRSALQRGAAAAEIERLRLLGEEIQSQIEASPAVAEQLDALDLEYRHLSQTFQDFANRHNEASVQAQMERRQLGEQFRVLESAFVAPEPSAPNRLLILVLGALFASMVGAGVGVLREATDTTPHDARQLQSRLQLPVLASIPQIWLESDRARQRRGRIRTALATSGVVMFALVGGAANYLWVNGLPRFLQPTASSTAASAGASGSPSAPSAPAAGAPAEPAAEAPAEPAADAPVEPPAPAEG